MIYGLLFYETEAEMARREGPDAPTYWQAWSAYIDLLAEEGVLVRGAGAGLHAPSSATTLRQTAGQPLVQDGPVADTKEQLGGLVLIDVPSLDDAMVWANKAPCYRSDSGAVEIRPVLPSPEG
jgi:hypothetical protein